MKKSFFIGLLLLLSVILFTNTALAGFGISPPYIKGTVKQGEVLSQEVFVLKSTSDSELRVVVENGSEEVNEWITYDKDDFVISASTTRDVIAFKVSVPADAKTGNYKGTIKISTTDTGSATATALGAMIDVDIEVVKAIEIYDVSFEPNDSGTEVELGWKTSVFSVCSIELGTPNGKNKISMDQMNSTFFYTFKDLKPDTFYSYEILCFGNGYSDYIPETPFRTKVTIPFEDPTGLDAADDNQTNAMKRRLRGRILLKVEDAGKAFYINPQTEQIRYLGRPRDAFEAMRIEGIGIKNSDLYKIPVGLPKDVSTDTDGDGISDYLEDTLELNKNKADTDGDGFSDADELKNGYSPWGTGRQPLDSNFSKAQGGRIVLQVEKAGEAWYINPADGRRYFLGRPADAFRVMRELGLGISNNDFKTLAPDMDEAEAVVGIGVDEAGKIALDFVNNYLVSAGTKVQLKSKQEDTYTYALVFDMNGQEIESHISKDGKMFFPQAYLIDASTPYDISQEQAVQAVLGYIGDNLVSAGTDVSIATVKDEGYVYKFLIKVGSTETESYLTKDGRNFFAQGIDIAETKEKTDNKPANTTTNTTISAKQAVPTIELFVMSHCPYGIQMEKGLLPVLELLGDKVNFMLKNTDYAMHGKKELDEQLRQYCIQKETPGKLYSYLSCFAADESKAFACQDMAGISSTTVNECVAAADEEFRVTEQYNDQSTWKSGRFPLFDIYKEDTDKYGVSGSPSLVINGTKVSTARDSASLLELICSAFEEAPEECNTELSSTAPSPGFGYNTVDQTSAGASCTE